jgi:hypothetical protein
MSAALELPFAHAGHWVGLLYVIPILVVIAGIVLRAHAEKKRERAADDR